jgi:hypothetical protein
VRRAAELGVRRLDVFPMTHHVEIVALLADGSG